MNEWCLVGHPNAGKTTVFNELTSQNHPIGNWVGVTVACHQSEDIILSKNNKLRLVDLPGVYSLNSDHHEISLDLKITLDYLYTQAYYGIIQIIDCLQLEKNLYLTSQLLELKKPLILILNKMDLAKNRGIKIDVDKFKEILQVPIIVRDHKLDLTTLETALQDSNSKTLPKLNFPQNILLKIQDIAKQVHFKNVPEDFLAIRILEGDNYFSEIQFNTNDSEELQMHDARFKWVHKISKSVQLKAKAQQNLLTAKIDTIVLHRFFGLPIFLLLIFAIFYSTLDLGQYLQNILMPRLDAIILRPIGDFIHIKYNLITADKLWFGLSQGIVTWLGLIPILAILYMWMVFLEASGYMARAAFLMDRVMRFFGLPGKAFVPMIIGFGCNVPAILASRTLSSKQERILTCLMAPFMSCSARLTIYAVFIAIFFPNKGYLILFALYFTGIGLALFTGIIIQKFFFKKLHAPLIMELPTYIMPSLGSWIRLCTRRIYNFMSRSGLMIVSVSMIITILNIITWQGLDGKSLLYVIGHWMTPVFKPMGITSDNWPATVGLLGGFLAKEVVIGTLSSLYGEINTLSYQLALPLYFHGQIPAFAYLLFILLYVPCISTFAAMKQEIGGRWVIFSVLWSLFIAYTVAVLFYQIATFFWG